MCTSALAGVMPATPPAKSGRHESSVLDPAAAAALALRASTQPARLAKRPRVKRGARDVPFDARVSDPDEGSVDAFERNALGPLLWHRPGDDELPDIPSAFRDERHYVEAFEPVLLEETREEIRNAWAESIGEGREYALTFRGVRSVGNGGWRVATFACENERQCDIIKSLCPEHSVAIVCVSRMRSNQTRDPWPRSEDGADLPLATAGFVEKVSPRDGAVDFKFFISPNADQALDPHASGYAPWHARVRRREREVLATFEGFRRRVRGKRSGTYTDAVREATANENPDAAMEFHAERDEEGEARPPEIADPESRVWWLSPAGKLSSASRSYEALHHVRRLHGPLRDAMLRPPRDGGPRMARRPPPAFADEIANNPNLLTFLEERFNAPQLAAIRWATAHTARGNERKSPRDDDVVVDVDASRANARDPEYPPVSPDPAAASTSRRPPRNEPGESVLEKSEDDSFPFTLVQGPPGTGKTHTVWGILNVIHFVLYQRYYQHLHRAIDLDTARAAGDRAFVAEVTEFGEAAWLRNGPDAAERPSDGPPDGPRPVEGERRMYAGTDFRDVADDSESAFAGSESDRGAAVREMFSYLKRAAGVEKTVSLGVRKPKILVCAPSNAAVDNVLERILREPFRNGDGGEYRPCIVRVGAADALVSESVRSVTASRLVDAVMKMSPVQWDSAYRERARFQKEALASIERLRKEHVAASARRAQRNDALSDIRGMDPEAAMTRSLDQQDASRVAEMLRLSEERDKAVTEMARFAFCLSRLFPNPREDSDSARTTRGDPNFSPAHQRSVRAVRAALEASFVDDAEIVFSTLTSSSRRVFRDASSGFETVLIDEAAQANEIAALIPFLHGAKRCVLVGDPRQLPSTVLSEAAKLAQFQRSLFERFASRGAEPLLLAVQYRMHPAIRFWPSRAFYDDRLVDSESVASREKLDPQPYQMGGTSGVVSSEGLPVRTLRAVPSYFSPYAIFDLQAGSQMKHRSGSLSNPSEALFCACLFFATAKLYEPGAAGGRRPPTVAIVTPYREQRACILKAFASLAGGDGAALRAGVRVSTVDGFQGQEADVVILSTVRGISGPAAAGGGGGGTRPGIGFLADIRRMNVALTRAKRALWIVGRCDVLRHSEVWGSLVKDAEERNVVVRNADSFRLFAEAVAPEKQERALGALGGGARPPGRKRDDAFDSGDEGTARRFLGQHPGGGWGRFADVSGSGSGRGGAPGNRVVDSATDYGDLNDS